MTVSLYRKYRPVRFEDVVGQDHITRTLVNAIRQDRVSHAYLFAGPRGTGKTTTAKILAMALNCESGRGKATVHPDGSCPRCEAIRRGQSLDVLELDAASNRGIDDIRDIRDKVGFAPVEGRMKVYIVDEVHMLTPEAFNALLKMLEEPPVHVVFVLATTEPHKVLPTILSRCQRFDFRRPSLAEISGLLKGIASKEHIEISEATLNVIARASLGSFRDAVGTLDQLATYCEGKVSMRDALTVLGVAEQDLLFEIVDIVNDRDPRAAVLFIERLAQEGSDLGRFLRDLLGHLRDLYVVQHTGEPPASLVTTEEYLDGLRSQANRTTTAVLTHFIDTLGDVWRAINGKGQADPRLELELALIKMTKPAADLSPQSLAARLDHLERLVESGVFASRVTDRDVVEEVVDAAGAGPASVRRPGIGGDQGVPTPPGGDEERAPGHPRLPTPVAAASSAEEGMVPAPRSADLPTIDTLRRAWPVLLNRLEKTKPRLYAALSIARPERVEDDVLTIRFPHGHEMQGTWVKEPEETATLQRELRSILGTSLRVLAEIGRPGEAEEEPKAVERDDRILKTSELIEHLQREFGATLIEDARPSRPGRGGP
ncbi:MAG: DNA polymerase III subunit gamma/tau [Actinobacteria bacterium]|nr:DNA polymerase III subunit gamma/tau [Actinomycetota bacterium]